MSVAPTPEFDSVSRLMAAVAAKQPAAQEILLRRVHGRVRRLARCLCAGEADADDVAQQSMLELLRSAGTFRFETSLERWVDRITIRCALRSLRRERRRQGLLARWLSPGRLPWGGEMRITMDDPMGLEQTIARLPYDRREVMLLRHGLGYGVDEIAELTNTPRGTVKDRLVAGKKQLRKWLREELTGRGLSPGAPAARPTSGDASEPRSGSGDDEVELPSFLEDSDRE